MATLISSLVEIPGQFKPSVQLPGDFFDDDLNLHFVRGYIPTEDILDFFVKVKDSFQPGNDAARARIISGTFGTGKSDLMLMLANYVTRNADDPLMDPFFRRLENINFHKARAVREARLNKPPFLLVLVQADTATSFSSLILNELQHSLEYSRQLELMGTTIYKAAVELIERWEQDNNPNLVQLRILLETENQITVPQMKIDLVGHNADLYFQTFTDIFERIVGMRFSAGDAIQRPSDALKTIAEQLVASGAYSGIFIICDEFTHLLEKLAQSPNDVSSKAIDNVAETATRSTNNQIHFTVVSLEPFSSMKASTQSGQDALERSGGRFINGSIQMTSKNVEALIGAAIQRLVSSDELLTNQRQIDDLVSVTCRLYNMSAQDALEKIVQNCYPLHPIVTYVLPRLNARLAQNERTTFRFLWDDELGLSKFINTQPAIIEGTDWHNLIPVSYLFSYFESSLEQKRSDLSLAYEEARKRMSDDEFEGLEGAIVHTLILFEVLNDSRLRADQSFIAQALNVPPEYHQEIVEALRHLQDASIAIPDNAGYFEINKPGRADPRVIRAAIDIEARLTNESMIAALNSAQPLNDVVPEIYNQEFRAKRSFRAMFVGLNELSSPAWIDETIKNSPALVLYVVATTDNDRAEAMTKARIITRENSLIVVAVPRSGSNLEDAYRRYRACRALRVRQDYSSEAYLKLLRDDGFVGKDYYNEFNVSYNMYHNPSNFDWFWQGEVKGNVQQNHLIRFASEIMKQVYSKGVLHNQQQHLALDKVNSASKKAIDAILGSNISVKNIGKKSADEAVLADGAAVLGLIQITGTDKGYHKYTVTPPTKAPSRDVWETISRYFDTGSPNLELLVDELKKPPFGLYPPVIAIFLAAFYQQNSDAIDVFRGSGQYSVSITSDEIIGIITSPKSYIVNYRVAGDAEKKYLRSLIEKVLFPGKTVSQTYSSSAGSLKVAVARAIRDWSADTGALVRSLNQDVFINIGRLNSEQAKVATEMIRLGLTQSDAAPIVQALLYDLPESLGRRVVPDSSLEEVSELLQEVQYIFQTVMGFGEILAGHILQEIADIFGATSYSSENREPLYDTVQSWFSEYQFFDPNTLTDKYAIGLFFSLRGLVDSHALKPVFLKDLPNRYGLEQVNHWVEISNVDKYIRFLQSAKVRIESQSRPDLEEPSQINEGELSQFDATTQIPSIDSEVEPSRSLPTATVSPNLYPTTGSTSARTPIAKPSMGDKFRSSRPHSTSTGFEMPNEPVFPDDSKLEHVLRKLLGNLREDNLTIDQSVRLFDELARRYGSK